MNLTDMREGIWRYQEPPLSTPQLMIAVNVPGVGWMIPVDFPGTLQAVATLQAITNAWEDSNLGFREMLRQYMPELYSLLNAPKEADDG